MRACPCCLEKLTPGLLGLGGRRLTGTCEGCGDAVCQTCLVTRTRDAGTSGSRRRKVCQSCLWEALTDRGVRPPFPAPPGQRERAARAARESCTHPDVKPWMGFCPGCGDEVAWKAEPGNPACEACGAPSHRLFNHCWACGESFEEENAPQAVARGYRLEFDCDSDACAGKLAWLMAHCPWCGEEKRWRHPDNGGLECVACERDLDRGWTFCVHCGEEAPLPDDCPRCGLELEEAQSAARCEQCRHLVCGDCFDPRLVPDEDGEKQERLLCSACGGAFEPASESAETRATADDTAQEDEAEAEDGAEEEDTAAEDEAREAEGDEAEEDEAAEDEPEEEDGPEEPRGPAASRAPPPPSPWEVLGVSRDTPLPEVRRAYLALVAQYHPDKVAQLGPKLQALAQEETRRIIEAWEQVRRHAR